VDLQECAAWFNERYSPSVLRDALTDGMAFGWYVVEGQGEEYVSLGQGLIFREAGEVVRVFLLERSLPDTWTVPVGKFKLWVKLLQRHLAHVHGSVG
jgi:hypothetical protein